MDMDEFVVVLPLFHPLPHIRPTLAKCYECFNFLEGLSSFFSAALFDLYQYYATSLNGLLFQFPHRFYININLASWLSWHCME